MPAPFRERARGFDALHDHGVGAGGARGVRLGERAALMYPHRRGAARRRAENVTDRVSFAGDVPMFGARERQQNVDRDRPVG